MRTYKISFQLDFDNEYTESDVYVTIRHRLEELSGIGDSLYNLMSKDITNNKGE